MRAAKAKQKRRRPQRASALGLTSLAAVILLLAAYLALLEYSRPHVSGERLRLDTFLELVEKDRIKTARILDGDAVVEGTYARPDGSTARYHAAYFRSVTLRERLADILIQNGVPTTIDQQFAKTLVGPLGLLLPALIIIVVFVYLLLSYRRGSGLFGLRSGAQRIGAEDSTVRFADVAGQDAAVEDLREVSQYLSEPERFAAVGGQVPKGILLFGPPGCGKTLLARALAGEAGASFYSISGSDFVELYVGVGASRVRDLFEDARENAPAIVFIDELDSIGRRRAGGGATGLATGSQEEREQSLNQILAEMDGFTSNQGIIVIGATNRPDILDPALLRPGRFDRTVGLERVNEQGRLEILSLHARGKPLAPDVDLKRIAHEAVGMTGADLANVVNEAALIAARDRRRTIGQGELETALRRIEEAPERQRRLAMRERSVGQRSLAEERVTFADVAGAEEAIEELAEVREYLGDPERFAEMGAKVPRGYLLAGPPGCGKTLLARAVAGESNATFRSVAATEFTEVFAGEGAARVRDLFAEAKSVAPAIVFIDEIDAIGVRRGTADETFNQLLVELDGFSPRAGVIVMAATNRPDILDPALARPGRFDRQVTIDLPDRGARRAILEVHARDKRLASDVDLDGLARVTRALSGADLANLMNEAVLLAARRGLTEVTRACIEEALDRAMVGVSGARVLSDEERRMVAYHEAGHGLVARALPGGSILHRLSIVSRGRALGSTRLAEAGDDRLTHSQSLLEERMATVLAGRVAEKLIFGEIGDTSAGDLSQVGYIARRMVCELGMSPAVGALPYYPNGGRNGGPTYSEETASLIDSEVRRLVEKAEDLARRVLEDDREGLDRVAEALIDRETLSLDEVDEIVKGAGAASSRA